MLASTIQFSHNTTNPPTQKHHTLALRGRRLGKSNALPDTQQHANALVLNNLRRSHPHRKTKAPCRISVSTSYDVHPKNNTPDYCLKKVLKEK